MEKELVWKMVQGQIGYDFKNLDLLQQAFTRAHIPQRTAVKTMRCSSSLETKHLIL